MTEELQPQEAETPDNAEDGNQAPEEGDKDYKAEAAKWRAIAERNKKKLEQISTSARDEGEQNEKEEPKKPTESADLGVNTVLKLQAAGFDAKAINTMVEEAGKLGIAVDKLATNETWLSGFKAKADAEKQKDDFNGATPPAGGRVITSEAKKYAEVVNNPDATLAEKQAAFEAHTRSLLGK